MGCDWQLAAHCVRFSDLLFIAGVVRELLQQAWEEKKSGYVFPTNKTLR